MTNSTPGSNEKKVVLFCTEQGWQMEMVVVARLFYGSIVFLGI